MKIIPEPSTHEPPPLQFSLRTLLIGVTIFCVLLGLLVPMIRSGREAARLIHLRSNFKLLVIGLHCYSNAHNQFPAAEGYDSTGKPINSWRAWIAPFMEGSKTEFDPNAAWDDPINSPFRTYFEPHFCSIPGSDTADPPETIMLAVTGPDTAFEDGKTCKLADLPKNLIIIVETRNSGFHWMEPGDLDIRTMPRTINGADGRGIAANIGQRFHVIFADGSVWQLSADVPFEDVEKFFTIEGAKEHDRDEVLGANVTRK